MYVSTKDQYLVVNGLCLSFVSRLIFCPINDDFAMTYILQVHTSLSLFCQQSVTGRHPHAIYFAIKTGTAC